VLSFIIICVVLAVGHFLRMKIRLIQKLYLPSCVVGGLLALALIQLLKGGQIWFSTEWLGGLNNTINDDIIRYWRPLPVLLINIVFACLFLGVPVPKFKELYHRAGPQFAYGQIVAWGQYAVAIAFCMIVVYALFPTLEKTTKDIFPVILPVGFEGGHGTAGGLTKVFEKNGWADGKDYAMASATFGILSAIIVGMVLVNWAARCGHTFHDIKPQQITQDEAIGVIPVEKRPSAGKLTVNSDAVESLTFHIVVVGLACLFGYLIRSGLLYLEVDVFGHNPDPQEGGKPFFDSFPLFPLCMLGGLFIQWLDDKYDRYKLIDLGLIRRIQNTALDFLVVAAIATINVAVLKEGIVPLLMLVAVGILWNMGCLLFLAKRVLPDAWFERAIAEMGQSMGVTATGLLLLRVVDPDYESPAADAFATKQMLHEPINGGGFWDSSVIPILVSIGIWPVFGITAGITIFWLAVLFIPKLIKRDLRGA